MNELARSVSEQTGIQADLAAKAVGIMVGLIRSEGDRDLVRQLMEKMPEAEALADAHAGARGGLLGRLGGGTVAAYGKLAAAGLDSDQIRAVAEAVFERAKERAGEDLVTRVVHSVPGLSRLA